MTITLDQKLLEDYSMKIRELEGLKAERKSRIFYLE